MANDDQARSMEIDMSDLEHSYVFTMESSGASGSGKQFISDYIESVLSHPEGSPERLENETFTVTSSYGTNAVTSSYGTNDVIFSEANARALRDGYGGAPGFTLDEDKYTVTVTFQTFDDYVNDATGIIEALLSLAHDHVVLDESVVSEVEYEVITGMVDQYRADVHENLDDWEDEFREVNEYEGAGYLESVVENVRQDVTQLLDDEVLYEIIRESDAFMDARYSEIDSSTADFVWDEEVLNPTVAKYQ